ncbi:hypothetical protein GH714_037345 [Hevea brasiliensis]|uniref:Protein DETOXIFICATION n=1 Tax=Hevea brasiliensis TaxID=3981 RepID=A0A6A6LYC8_HEVBR|nr:hypothetical protein GH714_037345 [Hevea brasiliensis]
MESQDELQEPILQSLPDPPAHSEGNSRLEKVLNDHQLPYFKRLRLASWIELKLLFRLAAPTVFVYMINNLMSLSTRVFAGHLGNLELAAASLAIAASNSLPMASCWGWEVQWKLYVVKLMELTDMKCLAHTSKEQTVVLTITGIPITMIYLFSEPILLFSTKRTKQGGSSSRSVCLWSNTSSFCLCCEFSDTKIPSSSEHSEPTCCYISNYSCAAFFHLACSVSDGFGINRHFIGVKLVMVDHSWCPVYYIVKSSRYISVDCWSLKNPEIALDSLAVCTAVSALLFMVSVGFNAAASVRVSNELGAGNPKSAAFSVVMVTLVSFIIAVIEAVIVLALRDVISYAFTSGETVANAVSELCPFWQSP